MKTFLITLQVITLCGGAFAKDNATFEFISSFIANERKPTHLVLTKLCWGKTVEMNLVKRLSVLGVPATTSMKSSSPWTEHGTLFVADLDCPGTMEVLYNASELNKIRSPFRWLLISENTIDPQSRLEELPLLPDSDWTLAQKAADIFVMTELHRPSVKHSLQRTPRGYFHGALVDTRPRREAFRRRRDLMGYTIMMINVIQDSNSSIIHMDDGLEPVFDFTTKVSWWIVKLVAEMLNAKIASKVVFRWGYQRNGVWNGMINELYQKKADIGSNCMVTTQRLSIITYGDMLCPFRIRFIFRQPPLSYVANIFYLPFTPAVWVAMLVCAAVSTVALYVTTKFEAKLEQSASQLDGSVGDALLLTICAVSQQGCLLEPKKASGRIAVWVLFTALMALYVAYSANIVVLLQAPSNSIRNLAQLANSKLTLAAHNLDYNYFVLKSQNDSLRKSVHDRINPEKGTKHFYSMDEGVEKIRQGFFAYHALVDLVYRKVEATFLESEKCDLMEVDFFEGNNPAVPIQKNSPYMELFRVLFKQIREVGIQSLLNRRVQVPKPLCSELAAFNSVGVRDIRGVGYMMLCGAALAAGIAALEVMLFKLNSIREKSKYVLQGVPTAEIRPRKHSKSTYKFRIKDDLNVPFD